jgi:hypothetical protein
LYGRWPELGVDEKRAIVEAITNKIIVGTVEIDIDLCYLPSPENMANGARNVPL